MVVATPSAKETTNLIVRPPPPIARRQDEDQEEDALHVEESPLRDGRNENSLAYLCQRFCEMYRNHSDPINIDLAAKELGIQRRRMYEILNIIQSVGLVGRLRSSFYRWDGYDKMAATLERLKEDGMVRVEGSNPNGSTSTAASRTSGNPACMSPEGQRRKAVATALGERFVQIFLCNEVPQPIILEDIMGLFASCMGVSATGSAATAALTNQTSCARRLYDIANVFCSIGLVRKTCAPATDNRRKKRLYVWVGPVPTANTTPLRPQRLSIVAPSASPGSGSAKRVKREGGVGLDTPKSIQQRKKSRLLSGNGGLSLEASMRKAEEQAAEQEETKVETKVEPRENVMLHPAVTVLRGGGLSLLNPSSPSGSGASRDAGARGGERGASAKAQSSTLGSSLSSPFFSSSTLFNPPNAKDGGLSPFTTNGGIRLKTTAAFMPSLRLLPPPPPASVKTSSTTPLQPQPSPPAHVSSCQCHARPPSHDESESPALLKAQIEQLKKELLDAKTRETELVKRVEMQDSQINKLIDAKVASANNNSQRSGSGCSSSSSSASASAAFQLHPGHSPLTSLVFSPFQGLQARDAFSSLTASPSPFSSANNFFSTGLTGSAGRSSSSSSSHSGRPPFTRKVRRGPNLVDLDDDFVLLPASSPSPGSSSFSTGTCGTSMKTPHLSPATASIASALLMSPLANGHGSLRSGSNKENHHHHQDGTQTTMPMPSPLRITAIKNEALAMNSALLLPSTPPRPCHLVATAASSLLSLTPSQIPTPSPSIARIFASDSSDLDADDDDVVEELSATTPTVSPPKTTTPEQDHNNDPSTDSDDMAARANASSPEPCAVRTPSSLAAPSSPSPSAKNAKKTTHLLLRHPHPTYTLKSSSPSSSSSCAATPSPSAA